MSDFDIYQAFKYVFAIEMIIKGIQHIYRNSFHLLVSQLSLYWLQTFSSIKYIILLQYI